MPGVAMPAAAPETRTNAAYAACLLPRGTDVADVVEAMAAAGIATRRYFYPALHTLPIFAPQPPLPVAEMVSNRVLCLPLHPGMSFAAVDRVCGALRESLLPLAA